MLTKPDARQLRKLITQARRAAETAAVIESEGYGSEKISTKEAYKKAEKRLQTLLDKLTDKETK